MAVGGLGRDPERGRDLLGLQAASEHADDPRLPLGQPRRPLESRHLLPGRVQDRRHRVGVEASGVASCASRPPPVRAAAARGRAAAPSSRSRRRRPPARRAGSGAPPRRSRGGSPSRRGAHGGLRRRCERRQERRARENALGVIRVEPHLLPLVRVQRPGLLPDPRVTATRPRSWTSAARRSATTPGSSIRQRSAAARPTPPRPRSDPPDTARSDRRSCPSPRARDRAPPPRATSGGRGSRESVSSQTEACASEARILGVVDEAGSHFRVEGMPCALAGEADDAFLAPEQPLECGIHREMDDPHRQRDLVAFRAAQGPWPSQRSNRWAKRPPDRRGRPSPSASIPATSHVAVRCGRISRAILGNRRAT